MYTSTYSLQTQNSRKKDTTLTHNTRKTTSAREDWLARTVLRTQNLLFAIFYERTQSITKIIQSIYKYSVAVDRYIQACCSRGRLGPNTSTVAKNSLAWWHFYYLDVISLILVWGNVGSAFAVKLSTLPPFS